MDWIQHFIYVYKHKGVLCRNAPYYDFKVQRAYCCAICPLDEDIKPSCYGSSKHPYILDYLKKHVSEEQLFELLL